MEQTLELYERKSLEEELNRLFEFTLRLEYELESVVSRN